MALSWRLVLPAKEKWKHAWNSSHLEIVIHKLQSIVVIWTRGGKDYLIARYLTRFSFVCLSAIFSLARIPFICVECALHVLCTQKWQIAEQSIYALKGERKAFDGKCRPLQTICSNISHSLKYDRCNSRIIFNLYFLHAQFCFLKKGYTQQKSNTPSIYYTKVNSEIL